MIEFFQNKFYNFKRGLKNLRKYFKIIWEMEDFDYHYCTQLFSFSLKDLAKHIRKHNMFTTSEQTAKRIEITVSLLDKVMDEFYAIEYMDYYKSNIFFVPIEGNEEYSTMEEELLSENFKDYLDKYKGVLRRIGGLDGLTDKEKCRHIARYNQERAHKLVFKLLEKNLRQWWC